MIDNAALIMESQFNLRPNNPRPPSSFIRTNTTRTVKREEYDYRSFVRHQQSCSCSAIKEKTKIQRERSCTPCDTSPVRPCLYSFPSQIDISLPCPQSVRGVLPHLPPPSLFIPLSPSVPRQSPAVSWPSLCGEQTGGLYLQIGRPENFRIHCSLIS